jgi:signal transduction protein with GAF and PtsI domain
MMREEPLGVLSVASRRRREFARENVVLLGALASLAAAAIPGATKVTTVHGANALAGLSRRRIPAARRAAPMRGMAQAIDHGEPGSGVEEAVLDHVCRQRRDRLCDRRRGMLTQCGARWIAPVGCDARLSRLPARGSRSNRPRLGVGG